jgi:hypothetical protein
MKRRVMWAKIGRLPADVAYVASKGIAYLLMIAGIWGLVLLVQSVWSLFYGKR